MPIRMWNKIPSCREKPKIPGLQRNQSRTCVSCGARAEEFCSRCGVTPYCSARCQRRDWAERHKDVCHNLAKLSGNFNVEEPAANEPAIPAAAPFRRPRSPTAANHSKEFFPKKEYPKAQREESEFFNKKEYPKAQREASSDREATHGSDKGHIKKFMPPGYNPPPNRGCRGGGRVGGRGGGRGGERNFGVKRPLHESTNGDEEWNVKPAQQAEKPKESAASPIKAAPSPLVLAKQATPPPEVQAKQATPPAAVQAKQAAPPAAVQAKQATSPPVVRATPPPVIQATPPPVVQAKQATSPTSSKPPATVDNVTPARKLVPKNCIIDVLTQGDVAVLSVEAADEVAGCWVCVSLHEQFAAQYDALLGALTASCEAAPQTVQTLKPALGEIFCLFNAEDGGWYRARRLSSTTAALIDAGRVAPISDSDKCAKLPAEFEATPEFCCTLICDAAKVEQSFQCTLTSKTVRGFKASLVEVEGSATCEGEVTRWRPTVQYPPPPRENATAPVRTPSPTTPVPPTIPEVPRPDVVTNSQVVLVDMTAFDKAFVRPVDAAIQRQFDLALEDVILYGRTATPLKESPHKGQIVVAKFSDGLHYRALVKRTNVKQNKYQLEYIEYGNIAVTNLENMYACPADMDLKHRPTVTSQVTLQVTTEHSLTQDALNYIETIKETELILTLPSGAKTAASGSAVILTIAKSKQNLNKKLEEMCAPEWKKIEERGGDVIETEVLMFRDLEYTELPADGCSLEVLDISTLESGSINVCLKGLPHAAHVLGPLTKKMADYCNSEVGREPYLPKPEELCIAQCPPYTQWFRAVLLEQVSGAGGQVAQVLYVDYGNVETIPVTLLRKMLPEFVRGLPALATNARLKDFPEKPTELQLAKAIQHMQINDDGRGVLTVTRCLKDAEDLPGWCTVEVPALIAALTAV